MFEEKNMRKIQGCASTVFASSKRFLVGVGAIIAFCAVIPAAAQSIFISNHSFEDPATGSVIDNSITGWVIGGTGGAGVWNINANPFGFWTVPAPDGAQIAYVSNATLDTAASISQVLGDVLVGGQIYSLTGYVGHPTGHPSTYTVELLAGGNVLGSVSASGSQGTFDPFLVTFDSSGSLFIGQTLEIRLSSSDSQTGFDNIALNAIPEPEIYAMMLAGLGLMGFVARRRKQQLAA